MNIDDAVSLVGLAGVLFVATLGMLFELIRRGFHNKRILYESESMSNDAFVHHKMTLDMLGKRADMLEKICAEK